MNRDRDDEFAPREDEFVAFYPDHVQKSIVVVVATVGILFAIGVLAMVVPSGMGEPADPTHTPAHVKPEWYFLSLYQLLKYIPKTVGAVAPVVLLGILALWPFLDRGADHTPRPRRIRAAAAAVSLILIVAFTIWGAL